MPVKAKKRQKAADTNWLISTLLQMAFCLSMDFFFYYGLKVSWIGLQQQCTEEWFPYQNLKENVFFFEAYAVTLKYFLGEKCLEWEN